MTKFCMNVYLASGWDVSIKAHKRTVTHAYRKEQVGIVGESEYLHASEVFQVISSGRTTTLIWPGNASKNSRMSGAKAIQGRLGHGL